MCVNVVHNSELPICSRLVNDVRRVAILPTKHSPVTRYSTTVLLIYFRVVREHADEIDWRFNGRGFTKSGRGQAKFFAALRAPNNTNHPFQNPGSATVTTYSYIAKLSLTIIQLSVRYIRQSIYYMSCSICEGLAWLLQENQIL